MRGAYIALSLVFSAPQFLKHETDIVVSYCIVAILLAMLLYVPWFVDMRHVVYNFRKCYINIITWTSSVLY